MTNFKDDRKDQSNFHKSTLTVAKIRRRNNQKHVRMERKEEGKQKVRKVLKNC